jgi:micrococcal nuclease
MKRKRRRRVSQNRLKRHPLVTALLVIFALAVMADRQGWFGPPRLSAPPISSDGASDVTRYHRQIFRVSRVVDGDTFDIEAPDGDERTTRIRLWGVDTPEVAGGGRGEMYFGKEASEYAKQLLTDQRVRLELVTTRKTRGGFGRLLAYVYLEDGEMLNEKLVISGHAYADPRFTHPLKDRMLALEKEAEETRAGLWKGAKRSDWPEWRQRTAED